MPMGALNARVGKDAATWGGDRKAWRGGKEWNGQRLLRLCAMNELVVLNSFYQRKDIHKFTWESKGRGFRSITDYVIAKRSRSRK